MATPSLQRDSLNGAWILDKTQGNWQMKEYLETMQVDPLAIEAHEKGDRETDTIHTITLDNANNQVTIVKRSRVKKLHTRSHRATDQRHSLHTRNTPDTCKYNPHCRHSTTV